MTATHRHKPGMTYYTDPKYAPEEDHKPFRPMHIFAAYDDVTNQNRGVLVHGPKPSDGICPIPPGTNFVIPKTVKQLAEAGSALMAARYETEQALAEAKRVALAALKAGVTEVDVATSLGVDRMTVRKWAGKR